MDIVVRENPSVNESVTASAERKFRSDDLIATLTCKTFDMPTTVTTVSQTR